MAGLTCGVTRAEPTPSPAPEVSVAGDAAAVEPVDTASPGESLSGRWNRQLQGIRLPELPAPVVADLPQAPVAPPPTGSSRWPWLGLGLVLGAFLVGVLSQLRGHGASAPTGPASGPSAPSVAVPLVAVPHTAPTPSPRHDVELLASQRLDADRAVVVVEVGEDRLVVGLNRALQAASLLGKLKPGEPIPARFVLNETPPVKPTSTRATETGPDEELDQLLDELLGKVRGFKPLAKQSHDT